MTGGIQTAAPSREVSLFTMAGVVLPIECQPVNIKPFQSAPTASIDPGAAGRPAGKQHLCLFQHRLRRLFLLVGQVAVLLQGCYRPNKREGARAQDYGRRLENEAAVFA